uniref:Uncharacterized protein n=1 Tax=Sphaerodactylus townsendi TaxID=933632 RepID=A0ACB8FGN6_9SAUR
MTMIPGKKQLIATACFLFAFASCVVKLGESLQVSVQPASVVQKYGGLVSLGCVVEPLRVSVSWRLNGKELLASDEVLGIHIDQRLLTITALNNHTVGRYQCIAHMPEGVVVSVPAVVTLASESLCFLP